MHTYYISPDFSCFEYQTNSSDGDYQYLDTGVDSEFAKETPIECYGSDSDLAGWTAYNIGSGQSNITLEALEELLISLVSLNFSESMNLSNNFREGLLYDYSDDCYTVWDDLDEDFQSHIETAIQTIGSYSNDDYHYYIPSDISGEYIEALKSLISAVKAYESKIESKAI